MRFRLIVKVVGGGALDENWFKDGEWVGFIVLAVSAVA